MKIRHEQSDGIEPSGRSTPRARPATRVLIVDDHVAFSESLATVLGLQDDLQCVGIAARCDQAVSMAVALEPDIVLMDITLPDLDGIEGTRAIKHALPGTRILMLTASSDAGTMARAASAGADGYLPKQTPLAKILLAIRTARGGIAADGDSLPSTDAAASADREPSPAPVDLTPREFEVLTMMGRGKDARFIAGALGITVLTCRGHIKKIHAKLGVHSQLEAVVMALRMGMIQQA